MWPLPRTFGQRWLQAQLQVGLDTVPDAPTCNQPFPSVDYLASENVQTKFAEDDEEDETLQADSKGSLSWIPPVLSHVSAH